jgi:hypothetical protein
MCCCCQLLLLVVVFIAAVASSLHQRPGPSTTLDQTRPDQRNVNTCIEICIYAKDRALSAHSLSFVPGAGFVGAWELK